jgi:hypothetical protein
VSASATRAALAIQYKLDILHAQRNDRRRQSAVGEDQAKIAADQGDDRG